MTGHRGGGGGDVTREKGRRAIGESTGSCLSLVLLGRGGVTRVEGVNIVKGGGREPLLSANWADNTIITECMRESGAIASLRVLSSLWMHIPTPSP
jgi:hypothetical protein